MVVAFSWIIMSHRLLITFPHFQEHNFPEPCGQCAHSGWNNGGNREALRLKSYITWTSNELASSCSLLFCDTYLVQSFHYLVQGGAQIPDGPLTHSVLALLLFDNSCPHCNLFLLHPNVRKWMFLLSPTRAKGSLCCFNFQTYLSSFHDLSVICVRLTESLKYTIEIVRLIAEKLSLGRWDA